MLVRDILNVKGHLVHSIPPNGTLADVVAKMVECNCGSLVVMDGDVMVGVITERDILRTIESVDEPLQAIPVETRMTVNLITGQLEDEVNQVMGLMTRKRIRHLPIVENNQLAGMVSIGDVVKAQHDRLTVENHYLMNYIQS